MSTTLPNWFWIIYYLFFVITMGTAIFSIVRKKLVSLSIRAIVLSIIVPIMSLLYFIGRTEGLNELEYLVAQLKLGDLWAIFVTVCYLYLVVWWGLFLVKRKRSILNETEAFQNT